MGVLNNIFGGLFGLMKCICVLSVVLYYLSLIDSNKIIISDKVQNESILYRPVEKAGNILIGSLKTYVEAKKNKQINANE